MTIADPPQTPILTLTAPDGTPLAVGSHEPSRPGPVVVIVHGIASHMGWYRGVGRRLAEAGYAVYLPDRRGSGRSGGPRGHMERWRQLVDDLMLVVDRAGHEHPGQPIHLLGLSLGGVVGMAAAIQHPDRFRSLVMSAPGFAAKFRISLLRRLRVLRRSWTMPQKLYDLPFGVDALTRRADWQAMLGADPLRTKRVSARFLVEMFKMQRFCWQGASQVRLPVLALFGGDDAVVDVEVGLRLLRHVRSERCATEVFAGVSHILAAELPRDLLLGRLLDWFGGRTSDAALGRTHVVTPAPVEPVEDRPAPPDLGTAPDRAP